MAGFRSSLDLRTDTFYRCLQFEQSGVIDQTGRSGNETVSVPLPSPGATTADPTRQQEEHIAKGQQPTVPTLGRQTEVLNLEDTLD